MKKEHGKTEIIREYCRKFPKHGNLTIAKAVYNQYPNLWPTLDAARASVRAVRGAIGKRNRQGLQDKSLVQPIRKAGEPSLELPRSIAQEWTPFKLGATRNLVCSDLHLPYHDDEAIALMLSHAKKFNPDGIVLNGDVCDFFSVSRWDRDPRQVNLKREIEITKEFLRYLRQQFPKASIVWKMGNHEERWEHFLWKKAPELLDVAEFDFGSIFGLPNLGIELVRDQRFIMAGKLPILHGHEYPKGLTNPVNQARGMFLRGLECAIAGHGHRSSEHAETTMLGHLITCWSTGCLCNLTPAYARINKSNHGFAFVLNDRDGGFEVQNKRIYKGRVW
jgi:predicted phosphodiesterase